MADWIVISSIASAGGTLVLAGTTYASVRSANRAARMAELSLLVGLRPLLIQSSETDPALHVGFSDGVNLVVPGEQAIVEVIEGRVYLAVSLRNVGPGIGVLHGGYVDELRRDAVQEHAPLNQFRMLTRDLYIPPGKVGFWQVAFRDEDPRREEVLAAVESGQLTVDVLYGDYEGGQRVISRFAVRRQGDGTWEVTAAFHWQVDRADPR